MKITRHEIDTADLVQAQGVEELDPARVRGALVKLAPRVTRPERAALDVVTLRTRVLAMGARGVVITPEMVAEPEPRNPTEQDQDSRRELARYIQLHASSADVRGAALALLERALPAEQEP
jgi:hypothetical protein